MTTTIKKASQYQKGDQIVGPTRPFSQERIGWYSIGMLSAAMGSLQPVQHNIHTDDEYARSQGLPAAIADGMHSTNWLSAMMADHLVRTMSYTVNCAQSSLSQHMQMFRLLRVDRLQIEQ